MELKVWCPTSAENLLTLLRISTQEPARVRRISGQTGRPDGV